MVVIGNHQRVRQFATFAGILSAGTEFNCIKFFFIAITFELYWLSELILNNHLILKQ